MSKGKKRFTRRYDTDVFMKNLYKCIVRDFRSIEGPTYNQDTETKLDCMKEFRAHKWPARSQAPVHLFKQECQLENLFKRYRFKDDVYTNKQLDSRTFQKFMDYQLELATPRKDPRASTYLVVQRARLLAKAALGKYSLEEHVASCRFGTKANLGIKANEAYLDRKTMVPTGSDEHALWFYKHIWDHDSYICPTLSDDLDDNHDRLRVESLKMVNVAKSWKIKRGIIPDTVLGGFYTNGLGEMIKARLPHIGLRFERLQAKHRKLAKKYSKTRSYVTADLSNASNSFTWQHMCRLLPREWLKVLDYGRVRDVTYDGKRFSNTSFMMMGIGYTSVVQTLLFHCLVTAVKDLLGVPGRVSVYGDDLIYPRTIHRHVAAVLTDLGFTLNKEKTFVQDHFRESCGGDFYHEVDVRPFQPEGEYQVLPGKPYVLLLYKALNGLLERWNEHDVPITVRFLLLEILRVDRFIILVPDDYPDYSGVHQGLLRLNYLVPTVAPRLNRETWLWEIPRYELVDRKRIVLTERPYLWDTLRILKARPAVSMLFGQALKKPVLVKQKLVKVEPQPGNYRSKLTGTKLKLMNLAEAEKNANQEVVYHPGN